MDCRLGPTMKGTQADTDLAGETFMEFLARPQVPLSGRHNGSGSARRTYREEGWDGREPFT
jgi:hypothetical protein